MKKSVSKLLIAITILLSITINAQIKNTKTETVKIYGNCGMCEKTIEKAGSIKKIAKVDWNKETQMATLTYDVKQTNQDEILKRIALAGYDSDKFLAPDDVYNNLHGCCQYDRVAKVSLTSETSKMEMNEKNNSNLSALTATLEKQEFNQLKTVFDNYFAVKDALVKTDGALASTKSAELLLAINAVKMDKLEMDVHMVWMKVLNELKEDAEHISDTQEIKHQRDHFMYLSKNIFDLMKVAKYETPVFYQFCPMANKGKGANWQGKRIKIP